MTATCTALKVWSVRAGFNASEKKVANISGKQSDQKIRVLSSSRHLHRYIQEYRIKSLLISQLFPGDFQEYIIQGWLFGINLAKRYIFLLERFHQMKQIVITAGEFRFQCLSLIVAGIQIFHLFQLVDLHGGNTVSYTHLDVYKRQELRRAATKRSFFLLSFFIFLYLLTLL